MAPFAGWEMPIQYPAGIIAEHRAVRTAAGLFDVSHMTALEVSGTHALAFLDGLLANCVSRLDPGEAQYSFLLRPDGDLIDDIYVYRLGRERFMLVGNAANADSVKDWFTAANSRRFLIDEAMPAKELDGPVVIRDLRDAGKDSRVGLALQGPASLLILQELAETQTDRAVLHGLLPSAIAPVSLLGLPALVAEIEGELAISMTEAGYGASARFHVPFFVGRKPYMERVESRRRHILRLMGQGRKTLRHGHVILGASGKAVGQVTSFAYAHEDMTFYVLACVDEDFQPQPGETVSGARIPAGKSAGAVEDRLVVELTVMTRHLEEPEREGWASRYA
jgi:glycine cleavage system aminomethyltransferase T